MRIETRGTFRHETVVEGVPVVVEQRRLTPASGYEVLELEILAPAEVRFAIDVRVPPECRNACVTLNGESLLDWFSDDVPAGLESVVAGLRGNCAECGEAEGKRRFNPLCPGRIQSLVFRWLPGDVLRFHFILG